MHSLSNQPPEKKAVTFGLVAIAVILIICSLIFTEVLSRQHQERVNKELYNQQELKKYAQEVMPEVLDKLFATNIISIESKITESLFGCQTTYLYEGQSDGENQYVKISREYKNKAPVKELCADPTEINQYLDSMEGERLWIDGEEYYRAGYSTKYEKVGISRSTTEEPQNYMANFFSAYNTKVEVLEATRLDGKFIVKAKVTEGEIQKDYLIHIDDETKRITSVKYSERNKTITSRSVDVQLSYEVPEIPGVADITDPYSLAPYREAIFAPQTSISIKSATSDFVNRQASSQVLSWDLNGSRKECSMRIRNCEALNRRMEQAMLEFFRALTPTPEAACSAVTSAYDLQVTHDTTHGISTQNVTLNVSEDKTSFQITNSQRAVSCTVGRIRANAVEELKSTLNLIFTN